MSCHKAIYLYIMEWVYDLIQIFHMETVLKYIHTYVIILRSYITPALKQLHWFPIKLWITFKVATLMYSIFHQRSPPYLKDLVAFSPSAHQRQLRSSTTRSAVVERNTIIMFLFVLFLAVSKWFWELDRSWWQIIYQWCTGFDQQRCWMFSYLGSRWWWYVFVELN